MLSENILKFDSAQNKTVINFSDLPRINIIKQDAHCSQSQAATAIRHLNEYDSKNHTQHSPAKRQNAGTYTNLGSVMETGKAAMELHGFAPEITADALQVLLTVIERHYAGQRVYLPVSKGIKKLKDDLGA